MSFDTYRKSASNTNYIATYHGSKLFIHDFANFYIPLAKLVKFM